MADAPQVAFNNYPGEKYPHYEIAPVAPLSQYDPYQASHALAASGETLAQNHQHAVKEEEGPRHRIFGLSRCYFWVLFILFELVLVGVIIGGSVGGTLAVQKAYVFPPSTPQTLH